MILLIADPQAWPRAIAVRPSSAMGWQLARLGKRVVLVDAELGGANLHTCLGVPAPQRSLPPRCAPRRAGNYAAVPA